MVARCCRQRLLLAPRLRKAESECQADLPRAHAPRLRELKFLSHSPCFQEHLEHTFHELCLGDADRSEVGYTVLLDRIGCCKICHPPGEFRPLSTG